MATTFGVLLRGINVGGKRTVKMAELRKTLEESGFTNVGTYIQSGNIALESDLKQPAVKKCVENLLLAGWGFEVPVVVLSKHQITSISKDNPFDSCDPSRVAVHVSQKSLRPEAITLTLEQVAKDGEQLHCTRKALYTHCPAGFARSKITAPLLDKTIGSPATARNWKSWQAFEALVCQQDSATD